MSQDVFPRRNLPVASEQWGREVERRILGAEASLERLNQSVSGMNRNIASSLQLLADQINAIPITITQTFTESGFAYPASYNPIVRGSITVPPGKSEASVVLIGTLNGTDMTSGGAATIYGRALVHGSVLSPQFPAAKDAAVSRVINVVNVSTSAGISVGNAEEIDVELQGYATNASAFPASANPANFATLTAIVTFV